METRVERVQQVYADWFKTYWQEQYRNYCQGDEGDPEDFALYRHAVMAVREMADPPGIPPAVLDAYGFYGQQVEERDCGVVTVAQLPVDEQDTFAVFVTTDGDDGWLEVFDSNGTTLGTARVYLELLLWGAQSDIRAMVHTGAYPIAAETLAAQTLWGKPTA
jgi:hypothetical protein